MSSDVTRDGIRGVAPDREARIGENAGPPPERRRRSPVDSMVDRAEFRSYYGLPVLNKPTWEPLDIAGYLFLGGMAGSSSALAAAAMLTGRPALARPLRYGAAGAITLSLAALVHDLGRPSRFYNMLRVFKPSSPMSVGSWILSAYGPAAIGAAALQSPAVVGWLPLALRPLGRLAASRLVPPLTVAAGALGPAVATYTAVLVSDTAVPAWHDGYREMPFLFAGSAASAGAGLGLATAPLAVSAPARRLGVAGALVEVAAGRLMRRRMGVVAETYESGKAGGLMRAAEGLALAGAGLAVAGRRSRALSAVAGLCLIAGSALTRFGIFHAGVQSAEDPKYTVQPQRERADRRAGAG
jgi:hypothetical protein